MPRFLLFEPWGLGDLAISLQSARDLHDLGHEVFLVCAPAYAAWAESLAFIREVAPFDAPWTAQHRKYHPLRYSPSRIWDLRNTIGKWKPDRAYETRGDLRNIIFLKGISSAPLTTLFGETHPSRYDRSPSVLKKMGLTPPKRPSTVTQTNPQKITCFFGAQWPNRRIPEAQAQGLVRALLKAGKSPCVILSPEEDPRPWQSLAPVIQGGIAQVSASLSQSDLCVSTDSAWLHVACLQGVPTIGLFGFKNAAEWAPPGCTVVFSEDPLPAEWRYQKRGRDLRPLQNLNIEAVIAEIKSQSSP